MKVTEQSFCVQTLDLKDAKLALVQGTLSQIQLNVLCALCTSQNVITSGYDMVIKQQLKNC
jgi:hypothetical protein